MEVKERIDKIKTFFINMNVADGAICVITKLPKNWQIGEPSILRDKFKCEIAQQNGATFFMTEMENGFDTVFDCIDYIVDTNRAIEEKIELMKQKAKELTDLFAKEPLEKLKTLYFAFDTTKKKAKIKKAKSEDEIPVITADNDVEKVEEAEIIDQTDNMATVDEEASSILSLASELIGG